MYVQSSPFATAAGLELHAIWPAQYQWPPAHDTSQTLAQWLAQTPDRRSKICHTAWHTSCSLWWQRKRRQAIMMWTSMSDISLCKHLSLDSHSHMMQCASCAWGNEVRWRMMWNFVLQSGQCHPAPISQWFPRSGFLASPQNASYTNQEWVVNQAVQDHAQQEQLTTFGQLCSLKLTRPEHMRATWPIAWPVIWLHLSNSRDLQQTARSVLHLCLAKQPGRTCHDPSPLWQRLKMRWGRFRMVRTVGRHK